MNHKLILLALAAASTAAARAQTFPSERPITAAPVEISGSRLPVSPATTTAVDLAETSVTAPSVGGVAAEAANFFVGGNGARSFTDTFTLRGLTNTPLFGDPAVTVYLDDLPLGSGFTFPSGLSGFTSAELFRGPGQNTRFGRAGTAGVLRFSTPAGGGGAGDSHFYYGNYNARGVLASGGARNPGSLDVYAAAGYEARDGYVNNTRLDRDIDGRESTSALARLRFGQPAGGEWTLLVAGQRVRDGVQTLVPLGGPRFEVNRSEEGVTHLDTTSASLRGAFDTSIGRLSTTTSFNRWKLGPATNALDFGFAELENGSQLRQRVLSEEINLVSAAGDRWQGSAGLFASTARTQGTFIRAFSGQTFEQSTYRIRHQSLAGFGEMTFQLNPQFSIIPGLRIEGNEKKLDREEVIPVPGGFDRKENSAVILPKLVASYHPDASTEATLGISTGYKPGGFSGFTGNRALVRFSPERVVGLDAALTRAQRGAWSATVRGFAYEIHGYQIERSFQTGAEADDYLVVNAPKARSIGAELELLWRATDEVSVGASLGVTHITLREFRDPYTHADYSGNRAPYAPFYDGNIFIAYHGRQGFFGRVETVLTGRTYYTEDESAMFSQSSYVLLNARIGYERGNYRVALYGANLTDRGYWSAITPGTFHATPGDPRTYGVEVGLKF
jgi:hypothetical protein